MKKEDIDLIESLLDKNEYFYKCNKISESEYLRYNFNLIDVMERYLSSTERKTIVDFLSDEFSVPKFKLSIQILQTASN